jgi:hypothetical protein
MQRTTEFRRTPEPSHFRGTRELKFSPVEQAAIRDAEAALGYRGRPQSSTVAPGEGISAFVRFLLGLFLLIGVLAVIGHLSDTPFTQGQQAPAATRVLIASSPRPSVEVATGRATVPVPQALPVATAGPQPPQSTIYTNVGNGVAAPVSGTTGETGNVAAAGLMPAIPQPLSPAPTLPTMDSTPAVSAAAPASPAAPAETRTAGSFQDGFDSAEQGSADSGWQEFLPPRSAPAAGGWHRFGDRQTDLASVETGPSKQPPGSWKRFKHRSPKRHSFLRRFAGGVGHVLAGVAKGVAAPLLGLTQGFQEPPLPFSYSQPTALPAWRDPHGLQAPPWAFPNFAPPGAEGRSQR